MTENIREIVFDTETTGLNYNGDDRVIDIGCVELINHTPTGKTYQVYINPERDVPAEVVKVHGITTEFLADKPKFAEIVDSFLEFIGDAKLVAHNATFDINFLNAELARLNREPLSFDRVIDTLSLSHRVNSHMSRHSLDALCKHYGIDNSKRDLHGALLDSQLLVEVYIELLGGKEIDFFKKSIVDEDEELKKKKEEEEAKKKEVVIVDTPKIYHPSRHFKLSQEEQEAHDAFVASFKTDMDKSCGKPYPVIWRLASDEEQV